MKYLILCLLLSPALSQADDTPSSKAPTETKEVHSTGADVAHQGMSQEKINTMENNQTYSKMMSDCVSAKNDKAGCKKEAMAACVKSMSKADCKHALKSK